MRSLRGRLALSITILLAAVLATGGLTVSRYVHRSDRASLDDYLKRTAALLRDESVAVLQRGRPPRDQRLDNVLSATGTTLRVILGATTVSDYGLPPPSSAIPRADGMRTFSVGGRRYRSYIMVVGLGGLGRLEVTRPLEPLERRLVALDHRLVAFGLAALLLGGSGAWIAATLLLRPLGRLRQATTSIAGTEHLDRRVAGDRGPAEVRSLAASFNDMLSRLARSAADRERALAATRRFTADAGHELRTPLTSVQATLSALSRHPDIPAERRSDLVEDALSEHRRLVDLLDGLQAMARGDSAPGELTDLDLADLTATSVDQAATRHPGVSWSPRLPADGVWLRGWEPGLKLVIDNLLENAARHGRPDGNVRVTLESSAAAGPILHVDDDGSGVAEEDRQRIFEPFIRVNGTSTAGSGLGLALVEQQARAHAATIRVTRSPLGGARFTVQFAGSGSAARR